MKWKDRRKSKNVQDRRGRSGRGGLAGSMMGVGGIGGIILFLLFSVLGGNFRGIETQAPTEVNDPPTTEGHYTTAAEQELYDFVSVILADTEDVWQTIFEENGSIYTEPTLVVYNRQVQSACGVAGSSTGPFYCPADKQLYIDLSFYDDLRYNFNAPGDFAMAYVVAHEVGHHVQTELGITKDFRKAQGTLTEADANALSVRFELQADYLAGVWAHHAEGMGYLEDGDYAEALTAAAAIGDDRIQKQAQGYAVPDSFTHGTSQERMYWFERGFETGDLSRGDTFSWDGKFY
ncbi:KPN_02809 family neutral zinc metallopeptidase [Lacticigenium naphthae]|uniref:KPN_02809 family neutral zinc metallopeptidase n=1 Tax=Lacticigenium naphthae TaxID=515351 RepID=UPI00042081A6|nr:neutral zinc metallopeptidase [Lacticigenium naphthae]